MNRAQEDAMTETIEQTPASATYVLTAGLVFALKQIAAARGISASELVREYLEAAVAGAKEPVAA
jgi:predicted DNA binding CopG/RHH family protein